MQYRLKAMTEKTVVDGQDFSERDLVAEKILLSPKMNFASRASCEKRDVIAALKQPKAAEVFPLQFEWYHGIFSSHFCEAIFLLYFYFIWRKKKWIAKLPS